MEASSELSYQPTAPTKNLALKVDFSWKKFACLITEKDDADAKPICIADFKTLKCRIKFKDANNTPFATAQLHTVSINVDCEIRGQAVKLEALKRFQTSYMHMSHALSKNGVPVPLIWASDCGFKSWDFVCLNQDQTPVARFSANMWAVKKVGNIEFMAPKEAISDALRDEIIVTGLTLFTNMLYRMNNIFQFFGAVFYQPSKAMKNLQDGSSKNAKDSDESSVESDKSENVHGSASIPGKTSTIISTNVTTA